MLVDCSLQVQTGGGSYTTVGDVIRKLRLADATIDSKPLVSRALKEWLDRCHADIEKSSPQSKQSKRQRNKPRRFVLETPRSKTRMRVRVPVDQGTGYLRRQSHKVKLTTINSEQSNFPALQAAISGVGLRDIIVSWMQFQWEDE